MRLLPRPIGGAQSRSNVEKSLLVGFARPVALERELEFAARTDARRPEGSDFNGSGLERKKRHRHNPNMLGAKAKADASGIPDGGMPTESHPHHRDTPPEDVHGVAAVSWLAGLCFCPPSRDL